jgi:hypothetical protein
MPLNEYRDEAGRFLSAIHVGNEPISVKIAMLQQELNILAAVPADDNRVIGHQVYDLLFLLFEIASQYEIDIDTQWEAGRDRKARKYL